MGTTTRGFSPPSSDCGVLGGSRIAGVAVVSGVAVGLSSGLAALLRTRPGCWPLAGRSCLDVVSGTFLLWAGSAVWAGFGTFLFPSRIVYHA